MRPRKKPINNGIRSIEKNLVKSNSVEQNVKNEIAKEIKPNQKK